MFLLNLITLSSTGGAATPPNDMTTEIIVAVLGAGGIGAILAAIITGLFSKRKLGAEATEIITKAAAGVVTTLEREIARRDAMLVERDAIHARQMGEKVREMSEMKASHDRQIEDIRRVLQLHVAWDAIAIAKMADFGVDLPPAPPLLPPLMEDRHA